MNLPVVYVSRCALKCTIISCNQSHILYIIIYYIVLVAYCGNDYCHLPVLKTNNSFTYTTYIRVIVSNKNMHEMKYK